MKLNQYLGFIRSLVIYYRPTQIIKWRRFYKTILNQNNLAFDIGAHVGSKARSMKAAGVKVIALEPQQPYARFLKKTLPKDIEFIQAAAGEKEQDLTMSVSSKHPTVSSLRKDFVDSAISAQGFEKVRWDQQQLVKVITLDSIIKRFGTPDYIKIDVEGYELEVLRGLSQPVKLISFEFLPAIPNLTTQVLERLESLGQYRFNIVIGEQAKFAWGEWVDRENLENWMIKQSPDSKSVDIFAKLILL